MATLRSTPYNWSLLYRGVVATSTFQDKHKIKSIAVRSIYPHFLLFEPFEVENKFVYNISENVLLQLPLIKLSTITYFLHHFQCNILPL